MIKRILLFLPLFFISCIDKFIPEFEGLGAEQQLVVEGVLNRDDYYMNIKLSRSIETGSRLVNTPENGAVLTLTSLAGNIYEFVAIGDGTYTISQNQFQPKTGDKFQLSIKRSNGEEYVSDFQEVVDSEPIEGLNITRGTASYIQSGRVIQGEVLEINGEVARESQSEAYYRYDYEGIYAFRAPYQGQPGFCEPLEVQGAEEALDEQLCYIEDDEILPANIFSNGLIPPGNAISENLITIIPNRKFAFGYNMEVRKHVINEEFYNFLSGVKGQLELNGSLFDPPPSQLVGNITSVANPNKSALGYFTIESVAKQTVFITRDFFKEPIVDPLNQYACPFDGDTPEAKPEAWCCDCSLRTGAKTEKPENWPI